MKALQTLRIDAPPHPLDANVYGPTDSAFDLHENHSTPIQRWPQLKLWRGCRELNSDLKVRSLVPLSVGLHPPKWSRHSDSNGDPPGPRPDALPLSYDAMVPTPGVEPSSSGLQPDAMTASAKSAQKWWMRGESNSRFSVAGRVCSR